MTALTDEQSRCKRCGRELSRNLVVVTRAGVFCARHADRLPPHLRRPPRPSRKDTAS